MESMTAAIQTQQAKQNETFHQILDEHREKEILHNNKHVFQTSELHEALNSAGLSLKLFQDVHEAMSQMVKNIIGDTPENNRPWKP